MNYYCIENLIPQRAPIQMVDQLLEVEGRTAVTTFEIRSGNYFADEEGFMTEPGLIENIAQSASALAGYLSREAGEKETPVGYIGEIKNFHCYRCPHIGGKGANKHYVGRRSRWHHISKRRSSRFRRVACHNTDENFYQSKSLNMVIYAS